MNTTHAEKVCNFCIKMHVTKSSILQEARLRQRGEGNLLTFEIQIFPTHMSLGSDLKLIKEHKGYGCSKHYQCLHSYTYRGLQRAIEGDQILSGQIFLALDRRSMLIAPMT